MASTRRREHRDLGEVVVKELVLSEQDALLELRNLVPKQLVKPVVLVVWSVMVKGV